MKRLEDSRFHSTRYFMEEYCSNDWDGVFFSRGQRENFWKTAARIGDEQSLPDYIRSLIHKVRELLQVALTFTMS